MMNYVGHGGLDRLATEGLLLSSDIAGLTNQERVPFVTALTCYLNSFAYPGYSTLGEELTLRDGGGALGVWSSSGMVLNSESVGLAATYLTVAFAVNERPVGEAIIESLKRFQAAGGSSELVNLYVLLGDPAVVLHTARQ